MIDGLKVTMTGVKLRELIGDRIRRHEHAIDEYTKQLKRPDRYLDGNAVAGHQIECHMASGVKRIEALRFIQEYIAPDEVYRLGEFDLRFVDLLPEEEWECDCLPPYRGGQGFGSAHAPVEQT